MDRQEKIWQASKPLLEPVILRRYQQSRQEYLANTQQIQDAFFRVLDNLFKKADALQQEGALDLVKHLEVAVLYSSAVTKSYESRIAVYDKNMCLGAECCSYWCPTFIYQFVDDDIEEIQTKLRQTIPRVRDFELDELRCRYIWNYHIAYRSWIESLGKEIFAQPSFLALNRAEVVTLLFGEFMGKTKILSTTKK